MRGAPLLALEVRELAGTIQEESSPERAKQIVVSGMLCEQLERELGAGAEPGAVVVDGASRLGSAEVVVHVMAAEPTAADEAIVRAADREGVPVVLVQLWPQQNWTPPFVLTPFVVECRAGEGFPLPEIAARIAEAAAERAAGLARRVPVLQEEVSNRLVTASTVRSALFALLTRGSSTRSVLTLEQVRMLTRLRSLEPGRETDELSFAAGAAAAAVGMSFVLREGARRARRVLPQPVANVAVAAGASWLLAEALRRLEASKS